MTISMQGSWTVSVKSKNASWAQRFVIEGSSNGVDGNYNETSPPVFVSGTQWGITIQHNPSGPMSWRQSRHRMVRFRTSGGQFLFDIESDDSGADSDEDFNDLILTCAMTQSTSEYVVYGKIRSYSGLCLFNPCYPIHYYVVDTIRQFKELLKYKDTRKILEKLYPERVKAFESVKPFPQPDPPPFKPLMIPSGLKERTGYTLERMSSLKKNADSSVPTKNQTVSYSVATQSATNSQLTQADYLALGRLKDKIKLRPCEVEPVSQTILRFVEYDRTAEEKLGNTYTGEGNRTILGTSATDEFGSFLFRFTQDYAQIAEEGADMAEDEDPATEYRPDVIIQLLESLPNGIMYETAPYFNIPNIAVINLCLPLTSLSPPRTCCQGGRAIQSLGNLSIITTGTTLHDDGTVSNVNTTGPLVNHAAWYGTVDLFACFLDTEPAVTHYTLSYRTLDDGIWSDSNYINQVYSHPKVQADGTWKYERVGPDPVSLRVNGPANPKVTVGAYLNIEDQVEHQEWQNSHRDRKIQISTSLYQAEAGVVEFTIEGYGADGEKVPGAVDVINLYIDNTLSEGDIDYIKLGAVDPGECALFELPVKGQALSVRYRAFEDEGFMNSYELNVYRGSNTLVPTKNTATDAPVKSSYQAVVPYRFRGTKSETVDPSGYVEINLVPSNSDSSWLPDGVGFCAFSFELSAQDRKTNGYSVPSNRILWRELVGISFDWPEA